MSRVQQCSYLTIQSPHAIDTHLVFQRFEIGFDRAMSGLTRQIPHLETRRKIAVERLILKVVNDNLLVKW